MSIESISSNNPRIIPPAKNRKQRRSKRVSEGFLALSYAVTELAVLFLLGLAIAHFYVASTLGEPGYYALYLTPLLTAPAIIGFLFNREGLYDLASLQSPNQVALDVMKEMGTGFIIVVLLLFLAGIAEEYSRVWFVSWAFSSLAVVLLLRGIIAQILSRLSNLDIRMNRIAIIGDKAAIANLATVMAPVDGTTEIMGTYEIGPLTSESNPAGDEPLSELIELGQAGRLDQVVIAKERIDRREMSALLDRLSILPCEILMDPAFLGETAKVSGLSRVQDNRMIRVQKRPISEWGLLAKSLFDRTAAAAGLLLLSPLFLVTAIAIKLDSKGPVFFKQYRHGYNQRKIKVWKFRTMTVMENGDAFRQATKNDSRVTRIGNFLRKSSIDELPQLVNVLLGDMSIVGPRPHPVALNDAFSKRLRRYNNRHKVKPGITGWAQINGYRGPTDQPGQMDKRVEYDLDYIENWSFWLDLKIILATPYYGLVSKNAF